MAKNTFRDINEMSFRDASVELEQIVRQLEGGSLELEDSLELYTRGVELLGNLRGRIADAEKRVEELLATTAGEATVSDTTAAPSTAFINE